MSWINRGNNYEYQWPPKRPPGFGKKISIALRAGKGLGINIEIILGIDQGRIENGNNSS